ncbi:MAG TPA: bifunctional hydroxymethylpyrimidine kinase/phosphomethylpyrimidine kinase [Caulobacteraceae bacterium]|jgi:pyridoxine kinase
MARTSVLILSSHVAASPVGGAAQAQVLARMGVESIHVPTVLFGRHPGLGPPGGGAVSAEKFESLIEGVVASGALASVDAVITGYFATPRQVQAAARLIDAMPRAWIVVDPIMGDSETGLYVSEAVAKAISRDLIPRARLVAPNAWELARLTGRPVTDAPSALAAARSLAKPVLVSSVDALGQIAVLYAGDGKAWLAAHPRQPIAPRGTGDLLTAHFVGAVVGGSAPREALNAAVGEIASTVGERPIDVHVTPL